MNGSLLETGSVATGGGAFLIQHEDIEEIGQQIGEQVAEAIGSGTEDDVLDG